MTTYKEHQDRACRRARGEEPPPDKSRPARTVLVEGGQLVKGRKPPAEDAPPPGVAASKAPGPRKDWDDFCIHLNCGGEVASHVVGSTRRLVCGKCGAEWARSQGLWRRV